MHEGAGNAYKKFSKVEGSCRTVLKRDWAVILERRPFNRSKYRIARWALSPPPHGRMFFARPGIYDIGSLVEAIYAKHVYILTHSNIKS